MYYTLISPRLAIQKGDFLGSGVPYWPIELATLAAHIRDTGDQVHLLDLFGLSPTTLTEEEDHYLQGMPLSSLYKDEKVVRTDCFIIFAISYMSHNEILNAIKLLKSEYPKTPILILENAQAVTAYSLQRVAQAFYKAGADMLICGEPYNNWEDIKFFLANNLSSAPPANVLTKDTQSQPVRTLIRDWKHPIPAWDLVNLNNYWNLPYSHGPKAKRYLPVLTSRGCPYPCDFCVVPETSNRRWVGNEPIDVVNEMIELRDKYGVRDFQIEDLNPTVKHTRWEQICGLLIEKNAGINFAFVAGTKAETIKIDKIQTFAKAGCKFISISPESGSGALMKVIGKVFDYNHAIEVVKTCRKYGIRTQSCFLVGHPSETDEDIQLSLEFMIKMVKNGLDEVAIFVVAPFAGSTLFARENIQVDDNKALPSFSPKGREDYHLLETRRKAMIRSFFLAKLGCGLDLWRQGFRAILGSPQTKMENLPRRIIYIYFLIFKMKFCWLIRRAK